MGKKKKNKTDYAIRLAENVALLAILDHVPEGAALNPTPRRGSDQDQRFLSFEQEKELCTSLAFIAGISDNYKCVMAVAVEEHRCPSRIHIKLAINKSKPENGELTLRMVVEGFKRVFKVLAKVANGDLACSPIEVFRAVLSLSRNRILQRLRSERAKATKKGAGKLPLAVILRSLDNALKSSPNNEFKTKFHRKSALLLENLDALEANKPGLKEEMLLQHIIEETGHFLKAIDLDQVQDHLEHADKTFDRGVGRFLKERLKKISHYRTVAVFLFKQAQELELFRNYQIQTVCHTPTLLPTEDAESRVNFDTLLQDFSMNSSARASLIAKIRDQHKKDDPNQLFVATASNTLSSGKVHAEVQLLFHYETQPVALRPRVIASTKSACFLCNALFRIHDEFYIPHSHGKLYPGWLLPSVLGPTENTLSNRLNATIQELNKSIIRELLSKKPRKRKYSGNESFVHELNVTISSLANSIASALASAQITGTSLPVSLKAASQDTIRPVIVEECSIEIDSPIEAGGDNSDTDTPTDHSVSTSSPQPRLSIFKHDTMSSVNLLSPEALQNDEAQDELHSSSTTSNSVTTDTSCDEACLQSSDKTVLDQPTIIEQAEPSSTRLVQGEKTYLTLHPDQDSAHVFTDFLNIFLEYPGKGIASSASSALPVVVEVEWLSRQPAANVVVDKAHDVHDLSTQSEIICQAHAGILLRSGDEIVRIGRKYEPSSNPV